MDRIPWPTDHAGLTADDIPYGYSAFTSIWDDHSGYEPIIVGREIDDSGHTVIFVELSPGKILPVTLVPTGPAGEAQVEDLQAALAVLRGDRGDSVRPPQSPATQVPATGPEAREARE